MYIYIAEGKDSDIVDPDHGANIAAKLSKLKQMGASRIHPNLRIVPKYPDLNDPEWTENFSQLPNFTFRTLFSHLANRVDDVVDDGEGAEDLGDCDTNTGEEMESQKKSKFRSFHGLDKGYRFFVVVMFKRYTSTHCPQIVGFVTSIAPSCLR